MGIIVNESQLTFHLQSSGMSYLLQVVKQGYLAHLYWGRKIRAEQLPSLLRYHERPFTPYPNFSDPTFSLDCLPQEYPGYGNSDFRGPAYQVQLENGSTVCDLRYVGYTIQQGKPGLPGLPATYVEDEAEATTLQVHLADRVTGVELSLSYTIYETRDVLTRSVSFKNCGTENIKLLRALSMSIDLPEAQYEMLHLPGSWAREREAERRVLLTGTQSIESRRGASSHHHNPFLALVHRDATEENGEVYGFGLVYSGNFVGQVEVDQYRNPRVSMGINPFDFSWLLEPGQSFQTPEVIMVYSNQGLGGMSHIFHRLFRNRLCRGVFRDAQRPILINNWEATYFNFTADSIERIAKTAGELGIELFVLDDGWFGKRNSDNCSLGDWVVNCDKLPLGLDNLARRVNEAGLQFGLWFEPEMVSPDSELYRRHPDWCLHVPNRSRSQARRQLILDLSQDEVCQAIVQMISKVLDSAPIAYVKWDMNRHMTEIGSAKLPPERQRETAHRYMLNLYRMLEELTNAFPQILFESCSGGGGRFDPGMLYYMPQTWTSDDTDAVARLKIQYGTSIVYPAITMGSHVSASPNHQVQRITSLAIRGHAASSGNLGYELDLTKLSAAEQQQVKEQVAFYKRIRPIIQFGDFYRLLSPFEGNETAWLFVTEDQTEAVVFYYRVLAEPNPPYRRIRCRGLDPQQNYLIAGESRMYGGDELMYVGLNIPESQMFGDFQSVCWYLKAVD